MSQVAQTTDALGARASRLAVRGPDHHWEAPRLRRILDVVSATDHDWGLGLEFVRTFETFGMTKNISIAG